MTVISMRLQSWPPRLVSCQMYVLEQRNCCVLLDITDVGRTVAQQ